MNKYLPNSSTVISIMVIIVAFSLLISHFYMFVALMIAISSPFVAVSVGIFVTWWYKERDNIWKG